MTPHPRRARSRGFSHVATTLEAASIMAWFAIVVVAEKKLDDAVTARRAAEDSATASAHASAGSCTPTPVQAPINDVHPLAAVRIGHEERLGLPDVALPPVALVGIPTQRAFGAQQTPLRHATVLAHDVGASGASFVAQRQVSCEDVPPATPVPPVAGLRTMLWTRNLMGY